ncbi:hypothetical protein WP2S18C03_02100 [Aeromonas veronii]|nr:hypothetical protein WP2S18C03_02100 [Aeromonas veronii]
MTEIINPDFELLVAEDSENIISGLLADYWTFTDFKAREYKYKQKELSEKYNIQNSKLSSIISRQGCIKLSVLMACQRCKKEVSIFKRSDLLPRINSTLIVNRPNVANFCVDCYKRELHSKISQVVRAINDCMPEYLLDNECGDKALSYIEKLILLMLITDKEINQVDIKEYQWNNFIQVEVNSSYEIINSLIEKRYVIAPIHNQSIKDLSDNLRDIANWEYNYIDQDLMDLIAVTLKKTKFSYVNPPSKYGSISSFSEALFDEVLNSSVSLFDVKQLDRYVKNKRISEIANIFEKVCTDKKIPYKFDNALQVVFANMADNFNLKQCNNIINYRSKFVVDSLNTARIKGENQYKFPYYFRHDLIKYLDYCENRKESVVYEKNLDPNWVISETEAFVSMHIVGDNKFWISLTAPEIVAKWVSVLTVV